MISVSRASDFSLFCTTFEHLVGGLAGEAGDVGQAALRIGQLVDRALELVGVAELFERVVQLARDAAELLEHFGAALAVLNVVAAHAELPDRLKGPVS